MNYRVCLLELLTGILILVSLFSCENEVCDDYAESDAKVKVDLVLSCPPGFTRSSQDVLESEVISLLVSVYSEGILIESVCFSDFDAMSVSLETSRSYNMYALANAGILEMPFYESDMEDLSVEVLSVSDMADGLPMSWSIKDFDPSASPSVEISLVRLVSKVSLDVDTGDTGLDVTSVVIRQSPLIVRPFEDGGSRALAGEVSDGDYASDADLIQLNNGGNACLYVLENAQGKLLPSNTDPMDKIPSNIPESADVCTYIEVGCSFPDGYEKEGTVCYRICLGQDACTDFNVIRNKVMNVSLELTDGGLDIKGSWKISSDYIQHASRVDIDANSVDMTIGDSRTLNAVIYPSDAVETELEWCTSDERVVTVAPDGTLSAVSEGECVVTASCKGRPGVYASCSVSVSDEVLTLFVVPDEVEAVLGSGGESKFSEFTVTAVYASGRKADVTDACSYSSDSASAYAETGGVVTHVSSGEAVITATYEGVSEKLLARTEDFAAVGVEFEQESYVVSLGDESFVRYRVLFNDGSSTAFIGYHNAQGSGWSCSGVTLSDYSVAEMTVLGRLNPLKEGTAILTVGIWSIASQTTLEATTVLKVNKAYLVSLYATATPMFYENTGGPSLYGVYSDGSERDLTGVASWTCTNPDVNYTYSGGVSVLDEGNLIPGETSVGFTGSYEGMSATAYSIYGRWIIGVRFNKSSEGSGANRYRLVVIYDGFDEEFVPFTYQLSYDGGNTWMSVMNASDDGVVVNKTAPATLIRAKTVSSYHNWKGEYLIWSVGY